MKQDFCIQMEALLGQDEANMLTQAIEQSTPPVSVRVNALKPSDTLPAPTEGAVPWCAAGQYLAERPRFTYDPLLHAGCYYVQEAASMLLSKPTSKSQPTLRPTVCSTFAQPLAARAPCGAV